MTHHGTTAAYYRHRDHGEAPCRECKDAFNADQRRYRTGDPDRQGAHFPVPDLPDLPAALCREVGPDLWHPENQQTAYLDIQAAKAICRRCPEIDACLEYAMRFPVAQLTGVWGATTQRERREMRAEMRRTA